MMQRKHKSEHLLQLWPNTVSEHDFTDAIMISAHTRIAKNKHAVDRAIISDILFTQHPNYLCSFSSKVNAVY